MVSASQTLSLPHPPEVENDRRALNVFNGMRRAKKEGRVMGRPPLGYVNRITETGKKHIAIKEDQALIMRWVFEELAKGQIHTEQIWKASKKKGLNSTRSCFWVALRIQFTSVRYSLQNIKMKNVI